jgi:dolichol-phosphate mannosyltransferase
MEKVSIVLPTYNEAENIANVIERIKNSHPGWHILVIDDSSPDGTPKIVKELSEKFSNIFLVERKGERGRGLAGIYGFELALKQGSDLIIEMDADMSHHPRYLEAMVRAAKDFDVVIGSRYIKGGREIGRTFMRRAISRLANLYLRLVLGFSVHDWTTGYRCYRRNALGAIISDIRSKGPSIVEEVLFKIKKKGFRIKEVPIIFYEREKGTSKLNAKILFRVFLYSIYLRVGKGDRHLFNGGVKL